MLFRSPVNPVHTDTATGKGSTLLPAARGSVGQKIEIATEGLLEIFGVSGTFTLAGGERLKVRTYHCDVRDRPGLALQCNDAGMLMISHGGKLLVRSGGTVVRAKAAYG